MFTRSVPYYDLIYSFKDYPAEAEAIRGFLRSHLRSKGRRLLDMACGTGMHLGYLKNDFQVTGADISEEFLAIARDRHPDVEFHQADMSSFDLGRRFDVILCLFSSIGYLLSVKALRAAARAFSLHLESGGVLLVEPWILPSAWETGRVALNTVDQPELKICRVCTSTRADRRVRLRFDYLVGTPAGTEHFVEDHETYLFTREEMTSAFEDAGLEVLYDEKGLMNRGLIIAKKRAEPA